MIEKHKLNRDEIIFLGDATTDMDAADFSKTHFALRENDENKEIFKNYKFNPSHLIKQFSENAFNQSPKSPLQLLEDPGKI